jgi:hypothetical protein
MGFLLDLIGFIILAYIAWRVFMCVLMVVLSPIWIPMALVEKWKARRKAGTATSSGPMGWSP